MVVAVMRPKATEPKPDPENIDTVRPSIRMDSRALHLLAINPRTFKLFALNPGTDVTIGRSRDCGLCIDDEAISRKHALLRVGSSVRIEDLKSANGTLVSGAMLPPGELRLIGPGTSIELGETVITLLSLSTPSPLEDGALIGLTGCCQRLEDGRLRVIPGPMHGDELRLFTQISQSDLLVLIEGETGVGKGVLADYVQQNSARAHGPYVKLDCASLTESVIASELFGHVRGAFTSAIQDKIGHLEIADGGTLFLDEVGELSLDLQKKLLRFLQNGEIERVGSTKTKVVDVRIIAATNRTLREAVALGQFRLDLYQRLNVVSLYVPPLRERPEQLERLSRMFLKQACQSSKPPRELQLSTAALNQLKQYSWPGNVRELEHTIQRASVVCIESVISPRDLGLPLDNQIAEHMLPPKDASPTTPTSSSERPDHEDNSVKSQHDREWELKVIEVLEQCNFNQSKAAKMLGISRTTLFNFLNEHPDLPRPRKKSK